MWTGADAKKLLESSRRLSVHSVFDRSFNLVTGGRLLHISYSSNDVPAFGSPFGVEIVEADFIRLHAEAIRGLPAQRTWTWNANRRQLVTPTGIRVDLPLVDTAITVCETPSRRTRHCAQRALTALDSVEGLVGRSGLAQLYPPELVLENFYHALSDWIDGESAGARWFLGRGPGLTPSGDDFLVGMMAALAISPEGERSDQAALELGKYLRSDGTSVTTDVSRAYLLAACNNRFSLPIRRLQQATDGDVSEILDAANDVNACGHFSGTDTLAGFGASLFYFCSNARTEYSHDQ